MIVPDPDLIGLPLSSSVSTKTEPRRAVCKGLDVEALALVTVTIARILVAVATALTRVAVAVTLILGVVATA
jgi:hypothetical protein